MQKNQIKAIGTSEGIVIGKAYVFCPVSGSCYGVQEVKITKAQVENEISRFETALEKTRLEIEKIRGKAAADAGIEHARIFDAHLLILQDKLFIDQIKNLISEKLYDATSAFCKVATEYLKSFESISDKYFRERTADIKDVFKRLLHNLTGYERKSLTDLKEDVIVVAHDLSPSETAVMHKERVIGFVLKPAGRRRTRQ